MAYTSGVKGTITIPAAATGSAAVVAFITRGDITIEGELFDVTTFDNQTNHPEFLRGLHDAKGTCEATFDGANTLEMSDLQTEDAAPTAGFKVWMIKDTHGYEFTGIISILGIVVEKRGQATVSISYESSGAITRTQPA